MRPLHEVADVVRLHGDDYRRAHRPSAAQEAVLRHVSCCRTAALGGHVDECDTCGHIRISYNSCRDRHCPKCQGPRRDEWIEARLDRLLPVSSCHVVFTIPSELNPLVLRNKRLLFSVLFAAAGRTLLQLAEQRFGAQIGFSAILHTWGGNLLFHPHLHCVVTAGGLSEDGKRWIPTNPNFFLPVKVLGRLFRGKFLAMTSRALRAGDLELAGNTAALRDPRTWNTLKEQLYEKEWVVYAKPPFAGVRHVFRYLGRYTHRVAISNHRIVDLDARSVTFTIKEHRHGGRRSSMRLTGVEFLRRFLLHVLPKGFVRIRHYGLYAARNVNGKLEIARVLLEGKASLHQPKTRPDGRPWWERLRERTGIDVMQCPSCHAGRLVRRDLLAPWTVPLPRAPPEAA